MNRGSGCWSNEILSAYISPTIILLKENENDQIEQLAPLATQIICCYQRLPDAGRERSYPESSQASLDAIEGMKQQEDNLVSTGIGEQGTPHAYS